MDIKRTNSRPVSSVNELGATQAEKSENAKNAHEGKAVGSKANENGVQVNLSAQARNRSEQLKTAFDIAKNTDPVRNERVEELKKKIANGTYQVESGQIADGMLMEAVKDELSSTQL